MPRDGTDTRTRIMDAAEGLILEQGFAASSVDAIVGVAGVTKGAFFHHFATKAMLAHALVERYAAHDLQHLEENMARAERLSREPLQQLLIFVGLLEEFWRGLTAPYRCLFASYLYEAQLFDDDTHEVIRRAMAHWREALAAKLRQAAARHPPRLPLDVAQVADLITVVFEGAFIVSKTTGDPQVVAQQLRQYRNYLELLFGAEAVAAQSHGAEHGHVAAGGA